MVCCTGYLLSQLVHRTDWYKERLYTQLQSGNAGEQMDAAIALARLGAQDQLLDALRLESDSAREAARGALEYIWYNSAGPEAYSLAEKAFHALAKDELDEALRILDDVTERYPSFDPGTHLQGLFTLGAFTSVYHSGESFDQRN